MPKRRFNRLFDWCHSQHRATRLWRVAALATVLALSACDNSNGPSPSNADESQQTTTADSAADDGDKPRLDPPPSSPAAAKNKLKSHQQTFKRSADHCDGDDCPKVTIDIELFDDQAQLNQAIRRRLVQQLAGDDGVTTGGSPSDNLEAAAESFLATAAKIPSDGARGWELNGESRQLGRWGNLLTVAISSYEFTGGAHGMPITHWLNWDLTHNRPVSLGQVIRPGQEPAFEQAAQQAHERWLDQEVNSDENFRDAWPFQETSDFRLTRKGVLLHYDVYAIAPYALGQPTLLIPWKALNGVIRDDYRPDSK